MTRLRQRTPVEFVHQRQTAIKYNTPSLHIRIRSRLSPEGHFAVSVLSSVQYITLVGAGLPPLAETSYTNIAR